MRRPRSSSDRFAPLYAVGLTLLTAVAPLHAAAQRLAPQPSAFLQSHASSPVDWLTWGDEAFTRAKAENKPVLLVIGTFTSELSRAMARQSFANAETAKFLNEQFVCVLVDAKERPDVAALYQNYLQAVKQVSGPPMNVWLTPDLKPFEGANYLPPTEEWGKEGFITVSKRVAAAWTADAAAQARKADEAVAAVRAALPEKPAAGLAEAPATINEAVETWKARYDATNGGFGDPPKYAEPELLRVLLRDPATAPMAVTTLRSILHSPVHDPLDGGFFRYGSDAAWRQPYFQKLLIDQARLALALLDAAKVSGEREFADAAQGALRYVQNRLRAPNGDLVAAEDATGEDLTPAYFWTLDELRSALGEKDGTAAAEAYGATAAGNIAEDAFPGQTVKGNNLLSLSTAAGDMGLAASATKLLAARDQRAKPRLDDPATSGAHGLLLAALARAMSETSGASDLASWAKAEADFIQKQLIGPDGGLRRLAGRATDATPADYALVADGLLTYARAAKNPGAAKAGTALVQTAIARYWDAKAGRFYATPDVNDPSLWLRVYSPAPSAGDPPSNDAAMLVTLATHRDVLAPSTEQVQSLGAALVSDAKLSADPARGDVLLALQAATAK